MFDSGQTLPACGACCLQLLNVGVRLGGHAILEGVNLHMHCGELTAIIGPNGAGKTTLFRAMLGELPYTGTIQFLPFEGAGGHTPRLGYVPQKLAVDPLSPVTVLDFFAGTTSRWPVWLGCRAATIRHARESLELVEASHLLHERVGQISGGQLQRVLLALALTPRPDILLLDEPVAGLDQSGINLFYEMISEFRRKYHLSILLVSHDLVAVAKVADRMVLLNRQVLCDGAPAEVMEDERVRSTLGSTLDAHELPGQQGRAWHERAGRGGRE